MFREFSARNTYNWVDMLDELVERYNNSYHRTIKMAPADVTEQDEERLQEIHLANRLSVQRGPVKFRVGDWVRISGIKGVFTKSYYPLWSTELFKITKVCNTRPVTYKLQDYHGRPMLGGFYNEEISKTNYPGVYLVERVLKRRRGKVLVKFLGFDDSENAWIPARDVA